MSELINARDNRATIRWKLLTGASALALTAYVSSGNFARAEDTSHPLIWLELGGQFDTLTDPSETWIPANLPPVIDHPVTGILSQKPRIGYDMDGSITFQPENSDWSLSAAIKFGKAKKGPRLAHDQTDKTHYSTQFSKYVPTTYAFTDMHTREETKHLILDFDAGKDVGLGLFGGHGSSTLKLGVRMAQFREKADGLMTAQTNEPAKYAYETGTFLNAYMHATRSFSGIGPSIAWNGSVPIAGSLDDGLALDWGANAALLFGRQRTKVRTHTHKSEIIGTAYKSYVSGIGTFFTGVFATISNHTHTYVRNKRVTVPNLGGMVGFSYRLGGEAQISFGYKADFFFNAIDGGIATAKIEDRAFFGPYASISIGLGD